MSNSYQPDLTGRDAHFDFGKNWQAYSRLISPDRLEAAADSVRSLVPDIAGKTFLDIGSGSGLFSAAALRLGAARVHAVDIDEDAVETTRQVLARFGNGGQWTAERKSVFELSPDSFGEFQVVYSWGVLHHTGDLWRAVDCAAAMVAPGGKFAFALYERTPLCGIWRFEKRAYMRASPAVQKLARSCYHFGYLLARRVSGRRSSSTVSRRGMDADHDVHDWLGGFPYDSTNNTEVFSHMARLGFELVEERPVQVHLAGLFGTGCSEYVYRRCDSSSRR